MVAVGLFPARYEHDLNITKFSYPCKRPWRPLGVIAVRFEHNLHIKSKAISVTGLGGL
jgi:hypothetical protein